MLGRATKRYGGLLVADGLRYNARYYRVTQVRSGIGTKPAHRAGLKTLGLGRIGKSNVLAAVPSNVGTILRVDHLVVIEPVADSSGQVWVGPPNSTATDGPQHSRTNGGRRHEDGHARTDGGTVALAEKSSRPDVLSAVAVEPDEEGRQAVKTLRDAIKQLHRFVLPDLTDRQLDQTAEMTAEAIEKAEFEPLDDAARRKLNKKVRETIDRPRRAS